MKKRYISILTALCICLIAAGVYAVDRAVAAESYRSRLREVYDGALMTSLTRIEDMQVKLSKALLTGSEAEGLHYLSAVAGGAESVRQNLSLLPLSHAATQSAVKFANQIGSYAQTLIASAEDGFSESDYQSLDSMIAACAQLTEALYTAREAIAEAALNGGSVYWLSSSEAEEGGGALSDGDVSYPTLIYDGPFSDDIALGTPKALGSGLITREDAEKLARTYAGESRVTAVSQGADTGGVIEGYGVTVQTSDVTLEMAISKTGGKLVWMSPDTAGFEARVGIDECRAAALHYLERNGYGDMRACYFQVYNGVAVINFAAMQGSVLLYPDMVKMQLRMDTAEVVGVEATRYLMNHTPRLGLNAEISEEEAQGALSELLTVDSARLCVIPLGNEEYFCYEFTCRYKNELYLVYIDAVSGQQREMLKVVENGEGVLTV